MARALAAIAVLWPLVQAATVAATIHGSGGALTAMVQIVGSRVCHQRPERSFHTSGVRWPVCARCSGLYFGAACGAWFGFAARMRRWVSGREIAIVLVVARSVKTPANIAAFLGGATCFGLRIVAVWQHWHLPTANLH